MPSNQILLLSFLYSGDRGLSETWSVLMWLVKLLTIIRGPSWSWKYGSWIYYYLCNQCLSPLNCDFESCSWWSVLNTTLCDKVCYWLAAGHWFSPVSSTNKTDCHYITEILLKVALNIIPLTPWPLLLEFILFKLSINEEYNVVDIIRQK
jgi:hypothetical protein